jgi:hypothetical protein
VKRLVLVAMLAACGGRATPPAPTPFGIEVGKTTVAEARDAIVRAGFACNDASYGALMDAAEQAGMPKGHRKMNGHLTDARVSCIGITADVFDPGRPRSEPGRVLLGGAAPDQAVAAIVFQRPYPQKSGADDDARAMLGALQLRLGRPAESRGELPLVRSVPVTRTWHATGADIEATAFDGPLGALVSERIALR